MTCLTVPGQTAMRGHAAASRAGAHLLQLLLGAQVVGVAALLLAAVHRAGVEARVALAADHLVAVVLARKHGEGGLDDSAAEAEHEVERGLLLDVVVAQGASCPPRVQGSLSPDPNYTSGCNQWFVSDVSWRRWCCCACCARTIATGQGG